MVSASHPFLSTPHVRCPSIAVSPPDLDFLSLHDAIVNASDNRATPLFYWWCSGPGLLMRPEYLQATDVQLRQHDSPWRFEAV